MNTAIDFMKEIQKMLNDNQIEKSEEFFYENFNNIKLTSEIQILNMIYNIYKLESESCETSIFDYSTNIDKLVSYFTKLKFLLMRFEFDTEIEDEFCKFIKEYNTSYIMVLFIINKLLLDKVKVLNKSAIELFNNGMVEYSINLLISAYNIEKYNETVLFNLAFILNYTKNYSEALSFINKIQNKNDEILKLETEIKEGIANE